MTKTEPSLINAARDLTVSVSGLKFADPVAAVYNPLEYAWKVHEQYLTRYGVGKKRVLMMGMNPGPWGMAQTGVPFGEIDHVRDWLGLFDWVGKPKIEHPKRPIEGFGCGRSEVSGRRLWGLMKKEFGTAENFFNQHFVLNFCPLVFMGETGKNITPDKLPAAEREPLELACDNHLSTVIDILKPEWLIGVGKFAEKSFERVAGGQGFKIGAILHPSPASPMANKDFEGIATRQMKDLGVW